VHGVGIVALQAAGRAGKRTLAGRSTALARPKNSVTPKIMIATEMRRPVVPAA
jgi:hypothetical protein